MSDDLFISVKNLGALMMPDHCQRCFWLALRTGFKGIWEKFGPIYSSIDRFMKYHVDSIITDTGHGPDWLLHGKEVISSMKPPRLTFPIPGIGVTVRGEPDAILECKDGKYLLIDYKAAKYKGDDDFFMPVYFHQLNAYATIIEAQYGIEIKKMFLCYASVQADKDAAADVTTRLADGFSMRFVINNHVIERNRTVLPDLACIAKNIHRQIEPPPPHEGCKDCQRLASWYTQLKASGMVYASQPLEKTTVWEDYERAKAWAAAKREFELPAHAVCA